MLTRIPPMAQTTDFPRRSHTCGALRLSDVDSSIVLNGWVESVRDHGGLRFLDLRDRYGLTQVVLDPESDYAETARKLRNEFVLAVTGKVAARSSAVPACGKDPSSRSSPSRSAGETAGPSARRATRVNKP